MNYLLTGEETERLKFRRPEEKDFPIWKTFFEHPLSAKFVGFDTSATAEECCRTWFDRGIYRFENKLGGMNVLINKQTNALIGMAGLLIQEIDGGQKLEIGYSMLPVNWNKGYASEAAIKCRDYAFRNKLSEEIISIIHPENFGSMKVATNNGMTLYKTTEFKGNPVNVFKITRQEWKLLISNPD